MYLRLSFYHVKGGCGTGLGSTSGGAVTVTAVTEVICLVRAVNDRPRDGVEIRRGDSRIAKKWSGFCT